MRTTIDYPKGYVVVSNPECIDAYRYSLEIMTNDKDKASTLFVLMKSPSKAGRNRADPTVNRIIGGVKGQYHKIVIVNTMAVVETNSGELETLRDKINDSAECNYQRIANLLKEAGPMRLLIATGNANSEIQKATYIKAMDEISNIVPEAKLYVAKLNASGYGAHPLAANYTELASLTHVRKADDTWHLEVVNED